MCSAGFSLADPAGTSGFQWDEAEEQVVFEEGERYRFSGHFALLCGKIHPFRWIHFSNNLSISHLFFALDIDRCGESC